MADIFVSYARADEALVAPIVAALEGQGWSVWWDPEISPGQDFDALIADQIKQTRAVLVVWTPTSVQSRWVRGEARMGADRGILVPVRFGAPELPIDVRTVHTADFDSWGEDVLSRPFQDLLRGLRPLVGEAQSPVGEVLAEQPKPEGRARLKTSRAAASAPQAPTERGGAHGRRLRFTGPIALGAVVATALVLGLAAWLAFTLWKQASPREPRLAVMGFDTLGQAPGLHDFAAGLQDQILGVMSANQMRTVSRADIASLRGADADRAVKRLGVTLLLDGTIQQDDQSLSVRVHLDDPRQHVTLWTISLDGAASAARDLQLRVATQVTSVLQCANGLQRSRSAPHDTDTIALFFHACDLKENLWADSRRPEQELDALRQVISRAPGFAQGHSRLAYIQASRVRYAWQGPDPARFKDASTEAHRALRIDPNDGDAWLALSLLQPVTAYQEREKLLARGLSGATTNENLLRRYAELLAEVGRLQSAASYIARAAASAPLDSESAATRANLEAAAGAIPAAQADAAGALRTWPTQPAVWTYAVFVALWSSDWTHTDALLDRPDPTVAPKGVDLLRTCSDALRSREPAKIAVAQRAARAIGAEDQVTFRWAIQCLAQLGLVDAAFEETLQYQPAVYAFDGPAVFFYPSTASMRRDRRFMPLMAKLGLLDYWRATGIWPDFCTEPGLPYDCKAEASKLPARRR